MGIHIQSPCHHSRIPQAGKLAGLAPGSAALQAKFRMLRTEQFLSLACRDPGMQQGGMSRKKGLGHLLPTLLPADLRNQIQHSWGETRPCGARVPWAQLWSLLGWSELSPSCCPIIVTVIIIIIFIFDAVTWVLATVQQRKAFPWVSGYRNTTPSHLARAKAEQAHKVTHCPGQHMAVPPGWL